MRDGSSAEIFVDGPMHAPDYASVRACVFTVPALASVGLTQAAAEEQGIEVRVDVNDMRNWLSGRTYAETAAWAKVLTDNTPIALSARTFWDMPGRS